jgi:DNA-binding CsgD family transcriptional regulator
MSPCCKSSSKEDLNALIATLKLSEREGQALELRLEGHSYGEIARTLKINEGDVKTYFFRIRGKWNNRQADTT